MIAVIKIFSSPGNRQNLLGQQWAKIGMKFVFVSLNRQNSVIGPITKEVFISRYWEKYIGPLLAQNRQSRYFDILKDAEIGHWPDNHHLIISRYWQNCLGPKLGQNRQAIFFDIVKDSAIGYWPDNQIKLNGNQ